MRLDGSSAVVTGGSRGLGVAVAGHLLQAGCKVLLVARSTAALGEVAKRLRADCPGTGVETLTADLTLADTPERVLQTALARFGAVDVVVNNAAVWRSALAVSQSTDEICELLAINLVAPIRLCRHLLPYLLARRRGHFVNISSLPGRQGLALNAAYSASKAGLYQFTNALRSELRGSGVSASTVLPSFVTDTGMSFRHGLPPPPLAGAVSAGRVAKAVVRCIARDQSEIIVSAHPVRPLLALVALFPGLAAPLIRLMGVDQLHTRVAAIHAAAAGGDRPIR